MRFLGKKEITSAWYTKVISYVAKMGKKVHFRGNFKVRNSKSTPFRYLFGAAKQI